MRNNDDDGSSTVLKELDLEYITNAECQSQYADFGDNAVTERMICLIQTKYVFNVKKYMSLLNIPCA